MTNTNHNADAYRPRDAARRMGISLSKLYEELAAGTITGRKAGRVTLITATEIERWLATLPAWQADDDE